jgi:hypothetical protein
MARMSLATIHSFAFSGIEAVPVEVQVQIASGLPAFLVVGLPDKAVGEARERVRAALTAMGLALPPRRVLINLAPADLLKEGSHFDLPMALAVLAAMDVLPREELGQYAALGELSLDGSLNPVSGVLPAAIAAGEAELGLILSRPARRRGGVGRHSRGARTGRPAVADQSFPRQPGADAAGNQRPGAGPGRPGPGGRKRHGECPPRVGNRCRRRPQSAARWPTGRRQIHAGRPAARPAARPDAGRGARYYVADTPKALTCGKSVDGGLLHNIGGVGSWAWARSPKAFTHSG